MKGNDLKEVFEDSIKKFYLNDIKNSQSSYKNIQKENIKRKLYLDNFSEKLFNEMYKYIYNDLDKCIQDYKSFNPINIEISFEDNKNISPLKSNFEEFFQKTSIPIRVVTKLNKTEFTLKIKTKKLLRGNRERKRILNEKYSFKNNCFFFICALFSFFFFWIIINLYIIEIQFILYIVIFFIIITLLSLYIRKINFEYYSSILNLVDENMNFNSNRLFLWKKKIKKIYSLPIALTENCSYYYLINAPRFHNIRFAKENKRYLKELNIRLPQHLSTNCLSFNIPRKKTIKEKFEFDVDLELPLSNRILCWFIGIYIILSLMIFSGIFYIIFVFNPNFLKKSFDISNLRYALTFLGLLIGFFGRDIIGNPTKDLKIFSVLIIIISIIVGIIFIIPIFL